MPVAVVNERMAVLRALNSEKTRAHRRQFSGSDLEAITLNTAEDLASAHRTSALTENFLPVELAINLPANQLVRLRVTGLGADNTLLAMPASSGAYNSDFQLDALPVFRESVLETTF